MAGVKPAARSRVLDLLHRSRMQPYLTEASGNEARALSLYRWHLDLTSSVHAVLSVTEVVLRNAMDGQLQSWNRRQEGRSPDGSWLLEEPAAPLRSLSQRKRPEALRQARKEAKQRAPSHWRYESAVTHDDVLAQVTFGLWKELLPNHLPPAGHNQTNENRMRLWRECLQAAFPNVDDPEGKETFWRVARVHRLRNRVSHLEPLLNVDVPAEIDRAFALLGSIDRDVVAWATGASRVKAVLAERPQT